MALVGTCFLALFAALCLWTAISAVRHRSWNLVWGFLFLAVVFGFGAAEFYLEGSISSDPGAIRIR